MYCSPPYINLTDEDSWLMKIFCKINVLTLDNSQEMTVAILYGEATQCATYLEMPLQYSMVREWRFRQPLTRMREARSVRRTHPLTSSSLRQGPEPVRYCMAASVICFHRHVSLQHRNYMSKH